MNMLSVHRAAIRWVWYNLLIRPAPRCLAPYGSHVPVLLILAKLLKPERILELGCGTYSTLLFLNSDCFPSLKYLVSIETDCHWLDRVSAVVGRDARWQPQMVDAGFSVADWLRFGSIRSALTEFDLIFVDDSQNHVQRRGTLNVLLSFRPLCPIVVHDVECPRLRTCLWQHRPYFVFDAFTPQTGICNFLTWLDSAELMRVQLVFRKLQYRGLSATNLREWIAVGQLGLEALAYGGAT